MNRTATLQIRTPEGVTFSQVLAGPLTRFLAWAIDFFILAAIIGAVGTAIGFLSLIGGQALLAFVLLGSFAVQFGYNIFFEWRWRGQSPGKRILRLRVVDAQGLRLRFNQVVIRSLLRPIDQLPLFYFVGGLSMVLNRRAQRLGDFAANTVVVRIPKWTSPNLDALSAGRFNSFREWPHLEARLRQRVSAQEASIALQALLRRDFLDPARRVELFGDLAAYFRRKVTFPPEASDNMTDEQYVRNVLETVFRQSKSGSTAKAADLESNPAPAPVSTP